MLRAAAARAALLMRRSGGDETAAVAAGGLLQKARRLWLPPAGLVPETRAGVGDWKEVLTETVKVLQSGRVVGVPTDTIYGITCLAQNSGAIRRIYEIKGRNEDKPLAICVGSVEDIYKYCKVTVSDQVLRDLLPGPVTLVFERTDELNEDLNPFTEEFRNLWPLLGLVVDGGSIGNMMSPECRLGSTVVNLAIPGKYSIIRPGCAFAATVEILQNEHGLSLQC